MGFGPEVGDVTTAADSVSIAVAGTNTVYTKAFYMKYSEFFALSYKATSDGTVNLKIELEQSWRLPTTEGASDVAYVVPSGVGDIESALADENWHNEKIEPVCMPYGRLKITGGTGNDATTVLTVKLATGE